MGPKKGGKPIATKKKTEKVVNPLSEERREQFGIGGALPPKKDVDRFARRPQVVRIQRKRRILKQRLTVPPALNQFTETLDKNLEMANQGDQSPINNDEDNQLITPVNLVPILENNAFVDFTTFTAEHQVIVEVVRGHPIAYAMSAVAHVPAFYVQQFWNTVHMETRGRVQHIVARIDHTEMTVALDDLRRILHLPNAIDGTHVDYEAPVSTPTLLEDLRALGLYRDIVNPSDFAITILQPMWATLFNLMNRCLSSKTRGVDKGTTAFLHIFHSIIYSRHIDLAAQFWSDLVKDITKGRKFHSSIPWMRFFQLMIRDHMDRTPEVRRRSNHPEIPQFPVLRVNRRNPRTDIPTMNIPLRALDRADQTAEDVIGYRASLGLGDVRTDSPEPATHLDWSGVENREELPHLSPSLDARRLLEPLATTFDMSSFPRTHTEASTALSFSSSAGTDVVLMSSDVVRGSSGSPVIANTMPALNTGRVSSFVGVSSSLGNLSGPGVTHQEFVSKEYLDGALKAVLSQVETRMESLERRDIERQRELDELRRITKGKFVATDSEPPVQSTPRVITSPLRLQPPAQPRGDTGFYTATEFNAMILNFFHQIAVLEDKVRTRDAQIEIQQARIRELEATCRGQSQPSKRRHDDPDDSDRHEGETEPAAKRLHLDLAPSTGTTSFAPTSTSTLAQTGSAP